MFPKSTLVDNRANLVHDDFHLIQAMAEHHNIRLVNIWSNDRVFMICYEFTDKDESLLYRHALTVSELHRAYHREGLLAYMVAKAAAILNK